MRKPADFIMPRESTRTLPERAYAAEGAPSLAECDAQIVEEQLEMRSTVADDG